MKDLRGQTFCVVVLQTPTHLLSIVGTDSGLENNATSESSTLGSQGGSTSNSLSSSFSDSPTFAILEVPLPVYIVGSTSSLLVYVLEHPKSYVDFQPLEVATIPSKYSQL
ncbi:hypothetical protein PVK06_024912 [Gossypium arboreum]|uniref:Uncharacterized protein n=1 Tax=Gossypium arboreum TaxID=29729 RepID=A0ABR0PF70_GOSAR|nr:hypothetical protein PVK06_024912 [Gossypium arboreum]